MNYKSKYTGKQIDDGIRPYKVYTAIINQTGTNAPVATVLENTLGGTVIWARTSPGLYTATLTGAFPANKTFIVFQPYLFQDSDNSGLGSYPVFQRTSDNVLTYSQSFITLNTSVPGVFTPTNYDGITAMSIEIRVYP